MSSPHPAAARPRAALVLAATLACAVAACAPVTPSPTPTPTASLASLTPGPTATPSATAVPTPLFTNVADPGLAALIPDTIGQQAITKPPVTEFSVTPGDIGEVYGEIGLRFIALQLAYVVQPRLSLYAMRLREPFATTADLEPYLAEAGRYVGIAGLHPEPWRLEAVGDRLAWVRPEDDATVAGTHVYMWAAPDGYVFLLIGVDDTLNRGLIAALPGESAPSPTPRPSGASPPGASEPEGSASADEG